MTLDDLRQHVASDMHTVLASLDNETLPGRRAKVEAQVGLGCRGQHRRCRQVALEVLSIAPGSSPAGNGCWGSG